jgi:hypothetical protein
MGRNVSDGRDTLHKWSMLFVAVLLALIAPAAAQAAAKPVARTGGVANVTFSDATLNGRVKPNGLDTTYFFQYGTTSLFGTNTAVTPIAAGSGGQNVSVAIGGLAPATRYHYRLVAQNARGITRGERRTFTTARQPLGVTLAANPNPVVPGGSTVLAGQLTGTNNAGRDVVLQSNPFPYLQGFLNAANPQVTDMAGNFSFPVLSVPVTTQFRVVLAQRPEVASPIAVVGAALQVRTRTRKVERHRRSVSVRFRGDITPQNDGGRVSIQRFRDRDDTWVTIAHTRAKDAGSKRSRFRTRVRLRRTGLYRAVAEAEGAYVTNAGRAIRIRIRR